MCCAKINTIVAKLSTKNSSESCRFFPAVSDFVSRAENSLIGACFIANLLRNGQTGATRQAKEIERSAQFWRTEERLCRHTWLHRQDDRSQM